jgi:outer membrane protein
MNRKMRMKNLLVAFITVAVFPVATVYAQAPVSTLTISQAVEKGLANSKQMRLDSLKIEQAKNKQLQVNDAAIPNVSASAGYTRLSPVDPVTFIFPGNPEPVTLFPVILNNYTTRVSVSETVFSGWRLKYTQESYGYLTQATVLDAEKDETEVKYNIMSAYISFVKLQLSRQILSENITAAQQRVTDVSFMRDHGTATDNDVLKAQLYQSNLQLSLSDVDNTIAVAQFNLCILLGLPTGTAIATDTTGLFAAISLLPEQNYETEALANRAETKAVDYRMQASQNNEKIAAAAYYPTVAVGANYVFARPNQRIIPYVDEFRGTWDAGITLSWSVTSVFTAKHSIADAELQTEQVRAQSEMLDDNIRSEVFQNYAACLSAIERIKILQLTLQQAEENSRQVKSKFNEQLSMMSDVLDADAAVMQARVNIILQRAEQTVSFYRLQKSTGKI